MVKLSAGHTRICSIEKPCFGLVEALGEISDDRLMFQPIRETMQPDAGVSTKALQYRPRYGVDWLICNIQGREFPKTRQVRELTLDITEGT